MTRTPDEIKKGLEYISIKDVARKLDAWEDGIPYDYVEDVTADALALIQQLEAKNAELLNLFEQLQAERDALMQDMNRSCFICKHFNSGVECLNSVCAECVRWGNWEWRGMMKEE